MTRTKSQKNRRAAMVKKARQRPQVVVVAKPMPQPLAPPRRKPVPRGKKRNPYLQTLINPNYSGVKVPDLFTMIPTGTCQLVSDVFLTVNNQNMVGVILDPGQLRYNTVGSTATAGVMTYAGPQNLAGYAAFANAYDQWRVVSACIEYVSLASDQSNGGSNTAVIFDQTTYTLGNLPPSTSGYTTMVNKRFTRAADTLRVCWKPYDNADIEFQTAPGNTHTPYIAIIGTGLTAGVGIQYRLIVNVECIPKSDSVGVVNVSPSPSDQTMLNLAQYYMSSVPVVTAVGAAAAGVGAQYMKKGLQSMVMDFGAERDFSF